MRKLLILFVLIVCGALFYANSNRPEGPITFLDYSYFTEDKLDTIEVQYIAWACACANWLPKENQASVIIQDTSCIFIESACDQQLPSKFHDNNYKIRLVGRYYKNKGISRDYEKPTSEKPEAAKIFQYMYYEIL